MVFAHLKKCPTPKEVIPSKINTFWKFVSFGISDRQMKIIDTSVVIDEAKKAVGKKDPHTYICFFTVAQCMTKLFCQASE